jgi:hypothetical protein
LEPYGITTLQSVFFRAPFLPAMLFSLSWPAFLSLCIPRLAHAVAFLLPVCLGLCRTSRPHSAPACSLREGCRMFEIGGAPSPSSTLTSPRSRARPAAALDRSGDCGDGWGYCVGLVWGIVWAWTGVRAGPARRGVGIVGAAASHELHLYPHHLLAPRSRHAALSGADVQSELRGGRARLR